MFRYFPNYLQFARFVNISCLYCGSTPAFIGSYFKGISEPGKAVCANCLLLDKTCVKLTEFTKKQFYSSVKRVHPDWNDQFVAHYGESKLFELEHTPPVPWLQSEEWPICEDDFAVYEGEVTQTRLLEETESESAAKELLRKIMSEAMPEWVQDEETLQMEWEQLANAVAVFQFACEGNRHYIAQLA